MENKHFKTVDEYIATFPKEIQDKLKKMRETIKKQSPEIQEIISYNMPAYKVYGRILLYFAAQTKHIGLYAMPSAVVVFKKELKDYATSKGTIQLPLNKPLPENLIRKIVAYRVKENLEKQKTKSNSS